VHACVITGIPIVENHGQLGFLRERQLLLEPLQLNIPGTKLFTVVIQSDLPDRNHPFSTFLGECQQFGQVSLAVTLLKFL
jgi:hypothetical protein